MKFHKCDEWLQKVKVIETEGGFHGLESVERVTPEKDIPGWEQQEAKGHVREGGTDWSGRVIGSE